MKQRLRCVSPIVILLSLAILLSSCTLLPTPEQTSFSMAEIPAFSGAAYITIDDNVPAFQDAELTTESFETYSELDFLGRCGTAYACIGQDLMPTEERGSIGQVKPSGWQTIKYNFIDGKYLYNRCHLIGYQLSGENANEKNLITGTRYLNISGMLPFENMVADYVKETGNHVLYRVTPIFEGSNLVASGVEMEGKSVEDDGEGVCFHVYAYNNQPGVTIDYATGQSQLADTSAIQSSIDTEDPTESSIQAETDSYLVTVEAEIDSDESESGRIQEYILNTNSKKFHVPSCSLANNIKETNRQDYTGTREALIEEGYSPCQSCKP